MHITIRTSLTFLLLATVLDSQGAGGGRQKQDSGHESGFFDHNSHDKTDHSNNEHHFSDYSENGVHYNADAKKNTHNNSDHYWSLVYILLFVLILIIIGCSLCGCCVLIYLFKSKLSSNNRFTQVATSESGVKQQAPKSTTIAIDEAEENSVKIFQSGLWSGRYFQYNQWHGPYKILLSFDLNSLTINGNGSDDVGNFSIVGKFSTTTKEIELTKKYEQWTGDEGENLGHSVTIEVTWNLEQQSFLGNWYVDTTSYSDEDRFELKFEHAV